MAWILHGGLHDAIFGAGCIRRMLERGLRPQLLIAAGTTAVNAVLASTASAVAFERGWERLRARRFVAAAAMPDNEMLAGWLRSSELMASAVRKTLDHIECRIPLLLASGTRFIEADLEDAPLLTRQTLTALSRTNVGSTGVAAAVHEATARGARRILLLGVSAEALEGDAARAALEEARALAVTVDLMSTEASGSPSLLELLLPGSGAVERIMDAGARAVETLSLPTIAPTARAAEHGRVDRMPLRGR